MAIPIRFIPDTPDSEAEIRGRLDRTAVDNAKAILAAHELLRALNDHGVIDALRGALGAGDTLVTKLAVAANNPESINAIRNLISLSRILGSIDPEVLHSFADEMVKQSATAAYAPPPSLWRALRLFVSEDSRRAFAGSASFLQAFGKALVAAKKNH